jgi:hypothetical protein
MDELAILSLRWLPSQLIAIRIFDKEREKVDEYRITS